MNYYAVEQIPAKNKYNAGSKARNDIAAILSESGVLPLYADFRKTYPENSSAAEKIRKHFEYRRTWYRAFSTLKKGDIVYIQYPVSHSTFFLNFLFSRCRKRGIICVAVIHDLEILRKFLTAGHLSAMNRLRCVLASRRLNQFSRIIAHNDVMKRYLTGFCGIPENRITSLEIFDYLTEDNAVKSPDEAWKVRDHVIIAGNLNEDKAGYVYGLPSRPVFVLYGAGFTGDAGTNILYKGAFPPDELPSALHGAFGLVWDGPDCSTCSGITGNYLRYNNPHKVSLYLASGIPVIIWKHAAMAAFVRKNGCGITVGSVGEISRRIDAVSEEEYRKMKRCAEQVGYRLRHGYYTKKALELDE